MNFIKELKRRNVFKVAAAYIIVGWLIMQAGEVMGPALHLPDWVNSTLAFFLILGFPLAVIFAWAFEMTPDGLKKEKDVDRSQSITSATGKKLNHTITIVLVLALGLFAFDKFVLDPERDAAEIATAVQDAQEQTIPSGEPGQAELSIAVLPFVNMSSDQEQEYFSDGLSEELLNLLAKIPDLRVAARTSSFSFKDQNLEIPEIATRLKVAHVLEGSVRKSGDQIRITAQLILADNGYHLWSETYDRKLDNIFQIQDEIALAVVDALKITLLGEAPKVRETDPEAYQLFLEGQFLRHQVTKDSLPRAIDSFKKALEIDPGYVPAWAEMAYTYLWMAGTLPNISIEEGNALADQAIETAVRTDPNHAFSYFVRGASRIFNKFSFAEGVEDYRYALELDPGNAFFLAATGTGARVAGQFDESINIYMKALALDPVMPEIRSWLGLVHLYAGNLDDAEAAYDKSISLSPRFAGGHFRLARVLILKNDLPGALQEMEQEHSFIYQETGLAMVHHALGNEKESQQALDELIDKGAHHAAYQIAEVYGFRGETDKAFDWLEQSLKIRDSGLASMLGDPALRGLRTDPRWQPFLEKVGLLEFWLEMPPEHGGPLK